MTADARGNEAMPMQNDNVDPTDRIACGIAGWSYEDWNGTVYPPGTRDKLRYIAPYFDMIEINSSFYRPPSARTATSWVARTRDLPGFFFSAKLHRDITHRGVIEPETVTALKRGFEPLTGAGMLRHLLAQFRYDFADTPRTREHLERIRAHFGDMTNLTLELRHVSWQSPEALSFLKTLGVTVANLDYPVARNSFSLQHCEVGAHAYLRLHGRNRNAWFSKGTGRDEKYDYLYTDREMDGIIDRILEMKAKADVLVVVWNNHYRGKAVANACQARARLSGDRVEVPDLLVNAYPELEEVAKPEKGLLFS